VHRIGCARAILALALVAVPGAVQAVKSGPPRTVPIDMVVIHATGGPACDKTGKPTWARGGELDANLRTIESHPKLGVHYMIDRDGRVRASVPEDRIAHHVYRYSARSIGIELVNDGNGVEVFPEVQIDALVHLASQIVHRNAIPPDGIKRHSDLDHGRMECARERRRKVDPGDAFPFEEVVRRIYRSP
jgi:N-acetyl-anhydromuramyl-L-alanine amidase AmpD